MPLGTNLASDLLSTWNTPPATVHAAATGAAQAYYNYVSGALFGLSVPVITTAMRDAMAATIETALGANVMATAAAAWSAGLTAFWTGVAVAGGSGAGTVTPPTGASAVPAALIAIAVTFPPVTSVAAGQFASVIQTATLTTQATLTLPPNPPVTYPIT